MLLEKHVGPILTDKQYKAVDGCYATPDMGRNEIEPNVVYWDWAEHDHFHQVDVGQKLEWRHEKRQRKQIKFLLLPNAISGAAYHQAEMVLKAADMTRGSRAANGQRYGTKLTIGWYPQLPGHAIGSGYYNVRTAPTLEQSELLAGLYPLFRNMDELIQEAVPEYYDYAWKRSMTASRPEVRNANGELEDEDDLSRVTDEHAKAVVKALDPWNMTYMIRGTVFSTAELNRNIVFKAHEDGGNYDGTCVCIAALGSFVGGRLVFPRYGHSAELRPRDLLLCDNNHELHANLGPIVGERYSVVAFLHESVCRRVPVRDGWGPPYEDGDGLPTPEEEERMVEEGRD